MRQAIDIILTSIIADLLAAIASGIIIAVLGNSDNTLLAVVWITGNIFVPTLLAVILFRFIKSITYPSYTFKGFMKQSLQLLIVLLTGLILWSVLDVLINHVDGNPIISKIRQDFSLQFLGFVPATISISFTTPLLDYFLSKKQIHQ